VTVAGVDLPVAEQMKVHHISSATERTDAREACHGNSKLVQLSHAGHTPYTTYADNGVGTDACMQPHFVKD